MDDKLERFLDLLDLVERDTSATTGTSVRLPRALREAANAAVAAGLLPSITDATVRGLQNQLMGLANRAILEEHFREHPWVRPELWELAMAGAKLEAHPMAERPDLVRRAAAEIVAIIDDPTPEEVLAYAAGLASGSAAA